MITLAARVAAMTLAGVAAIFATAAGPSTHVETARLAAPKALASSVLVRSGPEGDPLYGSGVAVLRGGRAFVWTAAHVVESNRTQLDLGELRVVVFSAVGVRQRGGPEARAAIVRYSRRHDLALLEVGEEWAPPHGARFCHAPTEPGEDVWHVGAPRGPRGVGSLLSGIVSATDRRRLFGKPDDDGLSYDQVCLPAQPGCSGGGVFRKADGRCLGLVTEFLGPGHTYGLLCYVPARRVREFSVEAGCEWAYDESDPPERDTHAIDCD